MARISSSTPLSALNAVSLDLETTGLDARKVRIVQIGAVRLERAREITNDVFDRVVDPHVPVPLKATHIHGIGNAETRFAPDLKQLWPELTEFLGNQVIIGHTIAYDLTVLEEEARRYSLDWKRPRSLCVRLLAQRAIPELIDPTLDKLAAWFNIGIDKRHSALSDAQTAAQIYLKMVPVLAEQGVRTLAEAERLCMASAARLHEGRNAGWVDPVVDPSDTVLAGGIKAFDTYAYRHMIRDVMSANPLVAKDNLTLLEAIRIMTDKSVSSLLLSSSGKVNEHISDYSIITERDAMRQIERSGAEALEQKVSSIASRPVKSIRDQAFVYRALSRMRRLKIRHLAVVDGNRRLVGVLSARDLLKARSDPAIALDDAIGEATSADDLAAAWSSLPEMVHSLIGEKLDAHTITRIVSEEIRSMTERAVILAEEEMEKAGKGKAPCAYCVIVLGSGGRGESLLKPDQDNAIIFEKGEPGGQEDKWFAELGERFAKILDTAGIPFCDGGIMAQNSEWRGSVSLWRSRIIGWIETPDPQSLLNVDILFDQIGIHGDRALANELFKFSYEQGSLSIQFCKALSISLNNLPSPFGFLGKIRSKNNQLDMKLHGLFPIVAFARALAIRNNFAVHSTFERLSRLVDTEEGDVELVKRLIAHHAFFLNLMLKEQEREIRTGRKPSNHVDLSSLSRGEMQQLKAALSDVQMISSLVKDMMFS